jgi:hypothetical protein
MIEQTTVAALDAELPFSLSASETSLPPVPAKVVEPVLLLLKEYTGKMVDLIDRIQNLNLVSFPQSTGFFVPASQFAWLLESIEMIQKPLTRLFARASGYLEQSRLDSHHINEFELRITECKCHYHHLMILKNQFEGCLPTIRQSEAVRELRFSSGIPISKLKPLIMISQSQ